MSAFTLRLDDGSAPVAFASLPAAYAAYLKAGRNGRIEDEAVVQILIDMKAPGCQWLYLTEVFD